MEISVNTQDDILEINLNGRLDAANSPEVHDILSKQIESGFRKIVMNFSNLDYISSSGLRVLLMALKSINKDNGLMHFYGVNGNIHEVFDVSGFSPLFPMFSDRREAIDALNREPSVP